MAKVLAKRVVKLMRGSIDVARGPPFVALAPKDPGVVFLQFNHEDSSVSDKDDINLSGAALIRNDDVSEFEELETPRTVSRACASSEMPFDTDARACHLARTNSATNKTPAAVSKTTRREPMST